METWLEEIVFKNTSVLGPAMLVSFSIQQGTTCSSNNFPGGTDLADPEPTVKTTDLYCLLKLCLKDIVDRYGNNSAYLQEARGL